MSKIYFSSNTNKRKTFTLHFDNLSEWVTWSASELNKIIQNQFDQMLHSELLTRFLWGCGRFIDVFIKFDKRPY